MKIMNITSKLISILVSLSFFCSTGVLAKEYLVVGSYGNDLHIIDTVRQEVIKTIKIPGAGTGPTSLIVSPDGKIIYTLSNAWSSLVGIEIFSGKQIFRADMTDSDMIVRAMFGLGISPDGKELYIIQQRTKKHRNYYEVLEPQVAVYNSNAGETATPVRSFNIPRKAVELIVSKDGKSLYTLSHDIHKFNIATGIMEKTIPVLNWQRKDITPPEMFNFWSLANYSDIAALPYYGFNEDQPDLLKIGVVGVNFKTDKLVAQLVGESTSVAVAVSVNPQIPHEAFIVGSDIIKIDLTAKKIVKQVSGGQLWQTSKISKDGKLLYTGGGICNIGVWSTNNLTRIGNILLPNCADQSDASLALFESDN